MPVRLRIGTRPRQIKGTTRIAGVIAVTIENIQALEWLAGTLLIAACGLRPLS